MRRLFVMLVKLVGLMQAYWALVNFLQVGFTLSMLSRLAKTDFDQAVVSFLGIGLYFTLSIGMAWILLFRTEWLADKLKIQDEAISVGLDNLHVLLIGVKLIGVYVAVHAIPGLAGAVLSALGGGEFQESRSKVISTAIQLGIGLFLALKSEKVVEVITKTEERAEPTAG